MGIAVIDPDEPAGYGTAACHVCGSSIHHSDKENHPADSKPATSSKSTHNTYSSSSHNNSNTETLNSPPSASTNFTKTTKDLVGNSKEFRIEHNKCDLRIIGNGNRIRIGCNLGNLQIIGNSTRLKISNNSGCIRYTGNDGRISLGSDSMQQGVDYIGNNGILKVVNSQQWNADCDNCKGTEQKKKSNKKCETTTTTKASSAKSSTAQTQHNARKVKVKSASYGGDCSAQWQHFNELFQRHGWQRFANLSLPNLKEHSTQSSKFQQHNTSSDKDYGKHHNKHCVIDNSINVVNNYGNIVIKNAVNVNI